MLISIKHQKIVLNTRNPNKIKTLIPTAKTLMYKGRELLAIPHKVEETIVLNNLGYDVPSPVEYYYDWPGRYKPFHAQLETVKFLTMHMRAFVLNDLGTGKTLSTLWAFHYLKSQGLANKLLVISPLSTLERAWCDEVFRNFPDLTFAVLHGSRAKRLRMLEEDVDVYVVNHDGVEIVAKEIAKRSDIDVVAIDELAVLRTQGTNRWKATKVAIEHKPRVWGLTGTPIPSAPTDAYAQIRLIKPENVPKYYGKFRDMVMRQVSQWKWVPRDNALEVVYEAMQPAVRFRRSDCLDLPPVMYETRHVELTKEQSSLYADMRAKLHAEFNGGQITAVNEAVKLGKLVQIACGVAYDNAGEEVVVPAHNRIAAVKEVIEEAEGKVIVFVPYTSALEYVAGELSKDFTVEIIQGSTKKSDRDRIFNDFQNAKDPRVLVANAKAMSHGLTLTAANVIIWYGPTVSNETYEQANGRITRPGQKLNQLIVHIEGTPVERAIYERLQHKGKTQGLLLDMMEDGKL